MEDYEYDNLVVDRRTSIARYTASMTRRQTIIQDAKSSENTTKGLKGKAMPKPKASKGYDYDSFVSKIAIHPTGNHDDDARSTQGDKDTKITEPIMQSEMQAIVYKYTQSHFFDGFIMITILTNTIMLVAQTWSVVVVRADWYFNAADNIFLGIYVMEVCLKMFAWRRLYLKNKWNVLDFSIVVVSLVSFIMTISVNNVGSFQGAAIFRLLRVFRSVRAITKMRMLGSISFLENLQIIMTTLLLSVRSIGAIVTLITLIMYMFAVIGRGLYAEVDPQHFGSLFAALFTLFQLLTLDDWFDINTTISQKGRWHIFIFLLLYIILEYFIFLNLFVAVLVDNFQLTLESSNATKKRKKQVDILDNNDDGFNIEAATSVSTISEESSSEENIPDPNTFEEKYPGMSDQERTCLRDYFRILASMECSYMQLNRQQGVLNMMVDKCSAENDVV